MAAKESSTPAVFPQVVRGPDLDRRAVLYSRVPHCITAKTRKFNPEKFANTANGADGRLSANMLMLASPVPKNAVHNWTA